MRLGSTHNHQDGMDVFRCVMNGEEYLAKDVDLLNFVQDRRVPRVFMWVEHGLKV